MQFCPITPILKNSIFTRAQLKSCFVFKKYKLIYEKGENLQKVQPAQEIAVYRWKKYEIQWIFGAWLTIIKQDWQTR